MSSSVEDIFSLCIYVSCFCQHKFFLSPFICASVLLPFELTACVISEEYIESAHIFSAVFFVAYYTNCGLGNSVSIATDYGLDGPGSSPGEDEIFRPSRPAVGPIQPPVNWVPVLSRG